mgnify:CR=1 FL=1|jgi:hypothetical protein
MNQSKIVIYQTQDGKTSIDVKLEQDTVWLTANQMSLLFDKDEKTIRKHINNIFKEGEVDKDNNTQKMRVVGVKQNVAVYTLDVIISVGYRVNSKRATFFRRWATNILKEYLIRGIAINDNRLKQLGETIRILKRSTDQLDAKQVLAVVEQYTMALNLLDDYDHQCIGKPKGNKATYILSYEECRKVINDMKFNTHNDLFGNEKDDSFHSSIGAIYQTFGGEDVYPSVEEKAANLLYFNRGKRTYDETGNELFSLKRYTPYYICPTNVKSSTTLSSGS